MMSVHTSPIKRKARPTGWLAQVSTCSVVGACLGVSITQAYHISPFKNNILDNRNYQVYTYFHKVSIYLEGGREGLTVPFSKQNLAISLAREEMT